MSDLATVDIPGIEILATGGPVKAIGSPPEGDFYTRDELVAAAEIHHELGEELRPPIKIGHSEVQKLAENSGLTAGEMPALGWLDPASFRVEDDEATGVSKLVADAKAVPARLAELMKAGAYRTRSSELKGYASQRTQRGYDWVVNGLALLGANVPAIQTLDDVYRLYERADLDRPDADTYVIRRNAALEIVWDPEAGFQDLQSDLQEALNPGEGDNRYWVNDISLDQTRAIVCDYDGDENWIVPFTLDANGDPQPAPSSDWIAADQAWVRASTELSRKNQRPAESRPMELTLTDEQTAALREKLGIQGDSDLTGEALVDAAETRANELAEAQAAAEAPADDETAEQLRKLEADLETEKRRSFEQRRDAKLNETMRTRELEPADLEKWHSRFDTLGEEACFELLDELPKRANARELGAEDGDEQPTEEQRADENARLNEIFPGANLKVKETV